jgi:hypothetical protein
MDPRMPIYCTKFAECSSHGSVEQWREDTCKRFLKGRENQSRKTGVMKNTVCESQLASFGKL